METVAGIGFLGLFFGMIGTTIGGVFGAFFDVKSNKIVSFILEVAARTYDKCYMF